jgi:hypothetical protein
MTPRARYETFLGAIKPDPRDVLYAPIASPPGPTLEVEARTPPGGGNPIPALQQQCLYEGVQGPQAADQAVRIAELAQTVDRGHFESVCSVDQTPAAVAIAREIRGMLGDSCLVRDIALPADCKVVDETLADEKPILPCSASATTDCYELVVDPGCTTSQHLRVRVTRSAPPAQDTMVNVRCRLPS